MELVRRLVHLFGDRWVNYSLKKDPFRLLISCILSTRTRDEKTEEASRRLFEKYPTPEALARADEETVRELIRGVGFYNVKARQVIRAARKVLEMGGVPKEREKLMEIPGIGRKCANIVLAYGFGIPAIPVDTHVHRISQRMGLVPKGASVEETERVLMEKVPRDLWIPLNVAMVRLGKKYCLPRNPRCDRCPLSDLCPKLV